MSREAQSIEVEVVEIDGAAPPAAFTRQQPAPPPRSQPWRNVHGRIRRLNSRWWPLWVILGVIVALFVLTFGIIFATALLILRMTQRMFRALIR